jgi:hypothetical protein
MLENRSRSQITGSANFTHVNSLRTTYSDATNYYAISHPSLPNYLSIVSGSDQGLTSDTYNPATNPLAGQTLADSLKTAGIAWKHYAEYLPSTGYLGADSGSYPSLYVQHHNPWIYFSTIRNNAAQYNRIVNYSDASVGLSHDLTAGTAPPFFMVQPGNDHNGHTGTDAACDTFVNTIVPLIQASTWYTAGSGIIILLWDESNPESDTAGIGDKGSNGAGGGHTMCIVISASNSAATLTTNINHYGLLRAIEKLYSLPYLANSAHTIDGDLTPLLGTTVGGVTTSNLGNGFKITAPADLNSRTLKVYTDVNQGVGTIAASLSDSSAPDYYDSSLNNKTASSAGVYTLVYTAAAASKLLNVTYTLSDNTIPGTTKSSDTFTRANQSNLGTASDSETYQLVIETGAPVWSIVSNQAQMAGPGGDTGIALLGSHTLLDCEAACIVNLSSLGDSGGIVLRANANAVAYYRARLAGSSISIIYMNGGADTLLSFQPATLKTNTNYWLRFRAVKSSLYARYWPNDGTKEPSVWHAFITDTTIATAGQYGIRGFIGAASDTVLFDTFSVLDLSATGDPSYVSLYAADLPTGVTTTSGALSAVVTTPAGTIDLTTEGTGDYAKWGYSGATTFDHKANVTQLISNYSNIGSGTYTQNTSAILAWSWEDGTPDTAVVASTTETTVQGVANGYSFTVPADTNSRTLNVYVAAKKAKGTLTATLSDGSATVYSDSSLNDTGTGTVQKYALTYNAASANQTLTITWTLLTDNGGSGSTSNYTVDTFTRANQTNWGATSDGTSGSWTQTTVSGSPTWNITSNKGVTSNSAVTSIGLALLNTPAAQANADVVVRVQTSNTGTNTIAAVLRALSTTTFYRASLTSGTTYAITKRVSGVDTDLVTGTFTYTTATNYWIHFRINGSNLYANFWASDGSNPPTNEPAGWMLTTTDSSIAGAGQWGLRAKTLTSQSVQFDAYTVTSIATGGTPGNIALDAASVPSLVAPPPPPPPPPPTAINATITVNANNAIVPNTWLGVGFEQDAYTQGTGSPITITDVQRALINTRINYMAPPIIRTAADSVSWWCPSVLGTYTFTSSLMNEWYSVFDNAQENGISVILAVNSPAPFTLLGTDWCNAFADLLSYLLFTLGYTCIKYVVGLSEPDMLGATYANYKNMIEPQLVTALAAQNLLNYVLLIGPDTLYKSGLTYTYVPRLFGGTLILPQTGVVISHDSWLTSSSADLAGTLEGYSRHAFPGNQTDISSDSLEVAAASLIASIRANDNTSKPIMQTEMGFGYMGPGQSVALYAYGVEMTDWAVQLARAGMAALLAYDLDDDMHGTEWGLQQITTDTGTPRPWFFPWSLLCNILVSGSKLYAPAQPSSNDLRVLAATSPTGAWTFVLVNRKAVQQLIQVIVPFAPVISQTLQSYVYSSAAPLLVDGNGFPLPSGTVITVLSRGFTVSIAPNSVLILTQQNAVQTNVFDVRQPPLQRRR